MNVITFDGNSVALYKAAAYVVTQLMNETVTILVQECQSSDGTVSYTLFFLKHIFVILFFIHIDNPQLFNKKQIMLHFAIAFSFAYCALFYK